MSQVQIYSAGEGSVLDAIAMRTKLGATARVRLFKAIFAPVPSSVLAQYVANEADFHGYAPVTVAAWDPVGLYDGGSQAGFSNDTSIFFQNDDGSDSNDIGGGWLEDTPAGPALPHVYRYFIFPIPVVLGAALAAINLEILLKYPGPGVVTYTS